MVLNYLRYSLILTTLLGGCSIYSQRLSADGGIILKAEITIGNQNQWLKLGASGFGTLNYGDISVESGLSFLSYQFLKRHTVKTSGFAYTYEFFALAGIGKNSNLLGSTVSNVNTTIIYNPKGEGGFQGLGFGFSKDYLPGKLKSYGLRRGAFLMRFSNASHNIHFSFQNDFSIGLFKGSGTDYGVTGSLDIGFTNIRDVETVQKFGFGIDLFTARPNYSIAPRNPINSDDGRKNVWFTLPPFKELFYGNLYGYATHQENDYNVHAKVGINSQKSGAYIQNILHDGLGLNPRFPWQVDTKDKIFIEASGNVFFKTTTNEE
ncbi:hypothetical protein [uncultured Aquimarina sp.]|uniref:hypothetical protein n=1 Tax=uncultured Aquimarina sp. TaxID=575652 RepID=UPI00262B4C07|nr:hypothetical protein [uncultured Aquimarina sp.]